MVTYQQAQLTETKLSSTWNFVTTRCNYRQFEVQKNFAIILRKHLTNPPNSLLQVDKQSVGATRPFYRLCHFPPSPELITSASMRRRKSGDGGGGALGSSPFSYLFLYRASFVIASSPPSHGPNSAQIKCITFLSTQN